MLMLRRIALLALAAGALCAGSAQAAPRARVTSLAGVPLHLAALPGANVTTDVCRVGQFGAPVGAVGDEQNGGTIYFGEDDTYWTYLELRSDLCPSCGSGTSGTLSNAHLTLYFPFAPETVTVSVSVVGIVPVSCHYPNYMDPGAVICAPFTATFDCQDAMAMQEYVIPIPQPCRLAVPQGDYGKAFLGFDFVSASDATPLHKPQLVVQAAARTCITWNPVGETPYDFVTSYGVGNLVMYADVSRCDSTARLGVDASVTHPDRLALTGGSPNPFRGRVRFGLALERGTDVDLGVFDLRGARVRSLHSGFLAAGEHPLEWDGGDALGRPAPAGVYFIRARSAAGAAVRQVLRIE